MSSLGETNMNVNATRQQEGQSSVLNGINAALVSSVVGQKQQQQQYQQQLTGMPLPSNLNSSNVNKFMPPTMAMANTSTNTTNCYVPAHTQEQSQRSAVMSPGSSLPPHLRPPIHGASSTILSNGGGGSADNSIASADSSRTSSPSLQGSQSHIFNQQDNSIRLQQQQQQQHITATSTTTQINSLTGSMQNLNMNRVNGPMPSQQQLPPITKQSGMMHMAPPNLMPPAVTTTQQNSQTIQNNFQYNFKTSALNDSPIPPTTAAIKNGSQQFSQQAPLANLYGSQPGSSWPPNLNQNTNCVTTGISTGSPLPPPPVPTSSSCSSNVSMQQQQNHLNNNLSQQPLLTNRSQALVPPQQANTTSQRKPLYPNPSQKLPPMPTQQVVQQTSPQNQQQQQQQQPQQQFCTAYGQQVPPSQPGMFNGQHNVGTLQYQNQVSYQQQQSTYPTSANVMQQGFNRLWGQDTIDLMQNRHILTPVTLQPPRIVLHNQFHESINCNHCIMRCTVAKIPESSSLLQKSRLPLGIVIHPFRDINSLPVIQCPSIVRCRLCRTYINPFVYFVDSKMWKCNLCYRVNELPDDFQFDPATKTYGDVTRRPEVRSSTIEFIAPSEYMLRPPQPAMYLFLFDVSIIAQQCGYLENICSTLSQHLDDMPGDARTQVGFITYNSQVHFYSMAEGYNQPHEMTLVDIDDPFIPRPDNLLVNLKECKELVKDLLKQLPTRFADSHDPGSALGAALQVAYKLMASGGRITVFQTCLPNIGPGSLEPREDPNNRSAKDVAHLNPATDFYKRYALECSGYQIAVDLFLLNQQYSDLATISGISKHSGGCIYHFPLYQKTKLQMVDALVNCFKRYLTRKIGFEAVMRIRCTRGLQVHTFHGNFFVRSIDLLSLPNVNPDAGYGMQISYEESLTDVKTVCFQAALLYTNSDGERRIRVHTLCLPVSSSLPEIMHAADSEAIIGLLSKMAVDRSLTSNVADAREAFINATVDVFNSFKIAQNLPIGQTGQLIAPRSLALMPLYILALLKHPAFRVGTSTRLDDRYYAMECMKTLPLDQLMKYIYPEFYKIDALFYNAHNSNANDTEEDSSDVIEVPRLQLSAEYLDLRSIFLLDCGTLILIYVGINVPVNILENVFGVHSTAELADYVYGLPNVESSENAALKCFIRKLNDEKPYNPIIQIIRDTSTAKQQFIEKLLDDRSESSLSYYEFLQHIRAQVK